MQEKEKKGKAISQEREHKGGKNTWIQVSRQELIYRKEMDREATKKEGRKYYKEKKELENTKEKGFRDKAILDYYW